MVLVGSAVLPGSGHAQSLDLQSSMSSFCGDDACRAVQFALSLDFYRPDVTHFISWDNVAPGLRDRADAVLVSWGRDRPAAVRDGHDQVSNAGIRDGHDQPVVRDGHDRPGTAGDGHDQPASGGDGQPGSAGGPPDNPPPPPPTVTPEPASMMLLGTGLVGLFGLAWRRKEDDDG